MKFLNDINFKSREQVLFFDIETASVEEELIEDSDIACSWAYKKRKDNLDGFQELNDSFKKEAPLYAPFARIVCISVGYISKGVVRKKSYVGEEKDILNNFFSDISQLINKINLRFICGFNIFAYDVPVVAFRSLVNGVTPHTWFDVAGMKPWNLKHIIDVSDLLRGTMFASMSLVNVVVAFGLPSPKDDIDGSEVSSAFYRGEIERIATYCEKDVEATIRVFDKITI